MLRLDPDYSQCTVFSSALTNFPHHRHSPLSGEFTFWVIPKYPDFADSIKKGRTVAIAEVAGKLKQKALSDDRDSVTAAIFFLKSVGGWIDNSYEQLARERRELEETIGKEASASVKSKVKFDADKYMSSQISIIFATLKRELDEQTYSRVCQALAQST